MILRKTWWVIGGAAAIGLFVGLVAGALTGLPSLKDLKAEKPSLSSVLLDNSGKPFSSLFVEQRSWVPLSRVPKLLQDTVIAVEDERFFSHWGIDMKALARALFKNLIHARVVEGGSTITQQLAKNLFLTRKKNLIRKIQEAITALRLERRYTKREILEFYLNQIYFGSGAYGVEAASRTYFAKSAQELTPGEIALLVGLPRSPNEYSPYKNLPLATKRRNLILDRMMKRALITAPQADVEKSLPLTPVHGENKEAPHFVEMIRQQLEDAYGTQMVYRGGLQVSTTLDLTLQTLAQLALNRALDEADKRAAGSLKIPKGAAPPMLQGAVLAISPSTGEIKAMIGGRNFRESEFNRATQAKRQPGSAFKPLIYATALDMGFTPATLLLDAPVEFEDSLGRKWKPQNYEREFYGSNTLRQALEHSRNVSTVKLLMKIGPEAVLNYAKRLGVQSELRREYTLALGVSEMTLWDLVRAFGVFANQGIRTTPFAVLRIRDAYGQTLNEPPPILEDVLSPQTAYLTTSLLTSVVDHGTAYAIRQLGFTLAAAGKTGTTDDNTDVWFIGYTPDLVLGVWVGYDDRTSMGKWASSAALAVPLWTDIMKSYYAIRPAPGPFFLPGKIVTVKIDGSSGKLATPKCPTSFEEVFLEGTAPTDLCPIHQKREFFEFGK